MFYQKGTFTGDYGGATSYPESFSNVIALEFGAPYGQGQPGKVNEAIAQYLSAVFVGRLEPEQCFFVSKSIYDALIKLRFHGKVHVISHGSSTLFGKTDVTGHRYDVFEQLQYTAKAIHDEGRVKSCLIVTHAELAGRAVRQAEKCGLDPRLPRDLPGGFDAESPQAWCRNRAFWIMRELAAQPYLKLVGKL